MYKNSQNIQVAVRCKYNITTIHLNNWNFLTRKFNLTRKETKQLLGDRVQWEEEGDLFTILNLISYCEYSVKISFIELYNEELTDLLSDSTEETKPLRIFDDSVRKGSVLISNFSEVVVKNKSEVYSILQKGVNRQEKEKSIEGEESIKVGKLNFVDLAGSENIEKSSTTGKYLLFFLNKNFCQTNLR